MNGFWKRTALHVRPIIHNEEVVRDLDEKGVVVVNDVDELVGSRRDGNHHPHGGERGVCEKIQTLGFFPWTRPARCVKERFTGWWALQWERTVTL